MHFLNNKGSKIRNEITEYNSNFILLMNDIKFELFAKDDMYFRLLLANLEILHFVNVTKEKLSY